MVEFNDNPGSLKYTDLRRQEEERFVASIAPQRGYPYVNLRGYTINPEALGLVTEEQARKAELVCFELRHRTVLVAVKEPERTEVKAVIDRLRAERYEPEIYMCSKPSLEHAWLRYQDVVSSKAEKKGVFEIDAEHISQLTSTIKDVSGIISALTQINTRNNTRRISETLELIFAGALALKASDIHIEPEDAGIRLRYRFDGVLTDITSLDSYIYNRLMSRLKLLSGMILNTADEAQDGRFTFRSGEREIEIRSSVIPGSAGESIVMRILDPTMASFKIENLGLNPRIKEVITNELKKPNGMIITTGPTGSGKTTALYAFLQETNSKDVKIITIENPVEYKLDGIVQTQTEEEYTFEQGLRAILRQDPDIIMVGEIRDSEVATTAIHAAQTGHLVFTTLHTNNAAAGFARLIDLGVDPRMLGTSLNIMMGQRLVRALCTECKVAYSPTPAEIALVQNVFASHPSAPSLPEQVILYKPVGCSACGNTGFAGRVAIFEGIIMDEKVEEAVIRDPREHVIIEAATHQQIPNMLQDGMEKVVAGVTSLTELERVIEIPREKTGTSPTKKAEDDFSAHIV